MFKRIVFLGFVLLWPAFAAAQRYYISPDGADGFSGMTEETAWKTFAGAFARMKSGDELVLLDGNYTADSTGYINYDCSNCAQPPSGVGLGGETVVRAKNPGKVKVMGKLFLGRTTRKDRYI